jgi:LysR family glycine cleavage system transcriptional activator
VIDALLDERLVRPFAQITQSPLSYWLVLRHDRVDSVKVQSFLTWIRSEVATEPDLPDPVPAMD